MSAHTTIDAIDYGPLPALVGIWEGSKGVDRAPEPGSPEFGIVQAPFMLKQAKTTAFTHTLTVQGDEMRYTESTILDMYDKKSYDHSDVNTLRRTG